MSPPQSVLSSILHGVVQRLAALGVDSAQLAESAGVNMQASFAPTHVLQAVQLRRIWHQAFELMPDPLLGFKVGPDLPLQSIGVAGLVLLHCQNLRAALQSVVRYQRLCPTGTHISLRKVKGGLVLHTREEPCVLPMHPAEIDSMFAGLLRILNECANTPLRPLHVTLPGAPGASAADYKAFFGCQVTLRSAVLQMQFADKVLDQPWPLADPALERSLRVRADAMLQTTRHTDKLVDTVQAQITLEGFARARCDSVAKALGMSERTLQRRLADCGTGFRALVDAARMETAAEMLSEPGLPHAVIAERLGYAEPSSFSHAVRAYFGLTPRALREKVLAQRKQV
jgi:AraC-like DNA-binding protein